MLWHGKYFGDKLAALGCYSIEGLAQMTDWQASDAELLERVGGGDTHACAELFDRYRRRLRRMVAMRLDKRVAARLDASDIVQDALNTAFARLPRYLADARIPFYPWLRRIAWDRMLKVHEAMG